ncbi:MAG TPA: glycosyltransferase family 41 protein [Gammaproteobacteria bacterium]|nr:glycosyltransferase family 41 protein [Gammaproteobacteria bacterium]
MDSSVIEETLKSALSLHQSGDLAGACEHYLQVLDEEPEEANALQLMGTAKYQLRELDEAKQFLERALTARPDLFEAHVNLGNVLTDMGDLPAALSRYDQALAIQPSALAWNNKGNIFRVSGELDKAADAYARALEIDPEFVDALNGLGMIRCLEGRFEEAIDLHRSALDIDAERPLTYLELAYAHSRKGEQDEALANYYHALVLAPELFNAHYGIGNVFFQRGRYADAIRAYRHALSLNPGNPEILTNLGNAYAETGDIQAANDCFQQALKVNPNDVRALSNLGNNLQHFGDMEEAAEQFRKALAVDPDNLEALNNLGKLLVQQYKPGEAIEVLKRALTLYPDFVPALYNYGYALNQFGLNSESIEVLREVVERQPDSHLINSTLLMYLSYEPDLSPEALLEEHRQWARRHADPLKSRIQTHDNDRDPDRPLRIGYVSMDLGRHPVGYMTVSSLTRHDQQNFPTYYYSSRSKEDDITARYRESATGWRRTLGVSDSEMAQMVRDDRIDILVDLSGHTAGGRLPVFAEKPAPLQATWIGYCDTTGVDAIDYILMDEMTAPPEIDDLFTEKVVRLGTRFCYTPPDAAPPVSTALPAMKNGYVTFGTLSNLLKVTAEVVAVWAKLLQRVPNSRLLISWNTLQEAARRERLLNQFRDRGVESGRILFRYYPDSSNHAAILNDYADIDIALDTFPYTGGITTSEALWMGVPVVTLRGRRAVSRQSASIIAAVGGMDDLITDSKEAYIETAARLAGDFGRLYDMRKNLRQRMAQSPFCNAEQFIVDLENTYRRLWRRWCER